MELPATAPFGARPQAHSGHCWITAEIVGPFKGEAGTLGWERPGQKRGGEALDEPNPNTPARPNLLSRGVKLLTLNLNFYGDTHGPWEARRDLIVGTLRAEEPDIVALQAVALDPEREEGLSQAAWLARELPQYDAVYQTVARDEDGREQGLAFLSRGAILETRAHLLSRLEGTQDPFQRLVLHGRFDTPLGELHAFCAHFSWVEAQALQNVAEALPLLGWTEGPAALLGDFNQTPNSETLRQVQSAGWTDAWHAANAGQGGFTFFENGALSKRIDYVLLNSQLAPRVREARVVLAAGQGRAEGREVRASDHAGVLVTLDAAGA